MTKIEVASPVLLQHRLQIKVVTDLVDDLFSLKLTLVRVLIPTLDNTTVTDRVMKKYISPTSTQLGEIHDKPNTTPLPIPNTTFIPTTTNSMELESPKKEVAFNKENCRKVLAKMVVLDEHAFKVVEGEGFKHLMKVVQPRFFVPIRMTVPRDIYQLYLDEKVKLKEELIKMGQRGIEKVFAVTVDNASANDVVVSLVKRRINAWKGSILDGDFMHFRCCAHIVNLIVNEGLKYLHDSIAAIRNVVRGLKRGRYRSSPARLGKFKACAEREKIDYKGGLILDVPTRWNSTFMMLDVAIIFEKAFSRYEEEDDRFLSYFNENESGKKRARPPTSTDWESAKIFVNRYKMKYLKYCFESVYDTEIVTKIVAVAVVLDPKYLKYCCCCA
ncbi:zinc finger BED domain-containing protein DAYSLEEPER-like [Cannabis sativa]|uniref:zinc finger BED domain-containing protein DAYSLEEPER-like n=1 Tax=Cannabis sativa TaxID=3483 RepID=UPI0029CAA76F|nr:zinc finger BED domain-containing protein DAYSLEEPER-like [Cannabis sativa]